MTDGKHVKEVTLSQAQLNDEKRKHVMREVEKLRDLDFDLLQGLVILTDMAGKGDEEGDIASAMLGTPESVFGLILAANEQRK